MNTNQMNTKKRKKRRNGPIWALRKFEKDVLRRFDSDLERYEKTGFANEETCENIKRAIRSAGEALARLAPQSTTFQDLVDLIQKDYLVLYTQWNNIKGTEGSESRKKLRSALKGVINDFGSTREGAIPEIHRLLPHEHVDQMMLAFATLDPQKFPATSVGVTKYRYARNKSIVL